jgi:hypothetical protein
MARMSPFGRFFSEVIEAETTRTADRSLSANERVEADQQSAATAPVVSDRQRRAQSRHPLWG